VRYLVTGSSGHLGEALVRTLWARDVEVVGIDRLPSPWTTVVGSIGDATTVRPLMEGVDVVLHTATLHKPHVATHTRADFVATNVAGTLTLMEAAVAAGVGSFVFTSTTSVFGRALTPSPGAPAVWITEETVPLPRNVYGATKLAAEHLAEEIHHTEGLPVVVLRTSRFFPEPDDRPEIRDRFDDANLKANELLHRRVDLADVVDAHLRAAERAPDLGYRRYVVSATTPFDPEDAAELTIDAPAVVAAHFPHQPELYADRGWTLPPTVDRVYDNSLATTELGWSPGYGFATMLSALAAGDDWRSPITHDVGSKGYHGDVFQDGLYPVK
jgi:UDP-glucose 4-epimerase